MLDHEPLVSHMLGKHFTKKLLPQHFSLLLRRGSDCGACDVTTGQEEVGTEEIVFTKVLGSILRTVVPSPHPTPPKKKPSIFSFVFRYCREMELGGGPRQGFLSVVRVCANPCHRVKFESVFSWTLLAQSLPGSL